MTGHEDKLSSRRAFLRTAAAVSAGWGVAGCLRTADSDEPTETTRVRTGTPDPSATATPTAADPTATPSETATATATETPTPTPDYPVALTNQWRAYVDVHGVPVERDGRLYVAGGDRSVVAFTEGGETVWENAVPEGTGHVRRFDPEFSDGDLYFTTTKLLSGEETGALHAMDAEDGTVNGTHEYGPSGLRPAVADGYAVIGTDHNEADDVEEQLLGLDLDDLTESWSITRGVKYRGGTGFDGRAIVGFGDDQPRLEARDPATGTVEWSAQDYVLRRPLVADGALYCAFSSGEKLARVDPRNGERRWTHEVERTEYPYIYTANPAVDDGDVFFGAYGSLHRLDAATGSLRWEQTIDGVIDTAPAVVGDVVWVAPQPTGDEDRNRELLGFDRDSGDLVYRDTLITETVRPIAFGDRLVVVMTNQLAVYAVDWQ